MSSFFPGLTSETEAAISKLAKELHPTWLNLQHFFGDDSEWLQAHLHRAFGGDVSRAQMECLRMELAAIEMTLSSEDRDRLKGLAAELRNGSVPLRLSDPAYYRQLDELILQRLPDRPMTFLRFQQLVLQLTNYLVGFGDTA